MWNLRYSVYFLGQNKPLESLIVYNKYITINIMTKITWYLGQKWPFRVFFQPCLCHKLYMQNCIDMDFCSTSILRVKLSWPKCFLYPPQDNFHLTAFSYKTFLFMPPYFVRSSLYMNSLQNVECADFCNGHRNSPACTDR